MGRRTLLLPAGVGLFFILGLSPLRAGNVLFFDDGFEDGDTCGWSNAPLTCPTGFVVDSPEVSIDPLQEITYCYYFRTPNEAAIGVARWELTLGPAVHDAALFATYDLAGVPIDREAPGTLSSVDCAFLDASTRAKWVFGAHESGDELLMPTDDGTGSPLAMEVLADQPVFLRIHFINTTAIAVLDSVTLTAEGLPVATSYTRTASYMTYATDIAVGSGQSGSITHTCGVPPGVQFWWLSTESHQFTTQTKLQDGAEVLLTNTDWEAPVIATYPDPFRDISAIGGLTYQCDYFNSSGSVLTTGDGPDEENCSGIGYFFPATQPYICFDDTTPI